MPHRICSAGRLEPAHAGSCRSVASRVRRHDADRHRGAAMAMSMATSDALVFAGESDDDDRGAPPWRVLIVDDEPEVHAVTQLALRGFSLDQRPLEFLHAHTGQQAVEIAREHGDIALILMDVVMETEHAGLDATRRIREELGNQRSRIVLRTGQPGQAPEDEVIRRYDINDYKEKTELTARKLFTLVYTSLRQYDELVKRDLRQNWLENLVETANTVLRRRSPDRLGSGIMRRLMHLLQLPPLGKEHNARGGIALSLDGGGRILHATGCHEALEGAPYDAIPERIRRLLAEGPPGARRWAYRDGELVAWLQTRDGHRTGIVVSAPEATIDNPEMLDLFFESAVIALSNARLNESIQQSQRELVLMLGEAIERRSKESGNHVRRVGEFSRRLAELAGLPPDECELLSQAAPLHDAGKIAIPDAILNKPGRHTEEEFEIMRTHAELGGEIFERTELPVLQAAAIVAHQHHERWDGRGYPRGLKGEQIHIYGRISALADVFDALCSERCYKPAWPLEEVLSLIRDESGRHFDPQLVERFLAHIDDFVAIRERFPDT